MSKYSIGVKSRGKMVKTYYEVIKGKNQSEQFTALRSGLNQIQNIVYKRIKRLESFESETGITSPALKRLRAAGFGEGVRLQQPKGSREDETDYLRRQYKALTAFLQEGSSKVKGIKEDISRIISDLKEVGYEPEDGSITGDEYEKFKALADKFYSEQAKAQYYRQSGYMTQAELQETANSLIASIMAEGGSLEQMLAAADNLLDVIAEDGLPEIEWIGTENDPFGKMKL